MPNKISPALILKRKFCICCRKHCRAYFHRHMECAVLKRFLKVQGTFLKKFLQTPLFRLEELNLIRFIKTLIKEFTPHPLRFAQHLLHKLEGFKTLPSNLRFATFPFRDGLLLAILYLVPKYRDKSRYFTESLDQTFKEPQR